MKKKHTYKTAWPTIVLLMCLLTGCYDGKQAESQNKTETKLALINNAKPERSLQSSGHAGQRVFEQEKFDGDGRSCATCHRGKLRSVTPEEAQALYAENPADPLFSHDAVDHFGRTRKAQDCEVEAEGCALSFQRFLQHATISVPIDLHPNVKVLGAKRTVFMNRGIPTTVDIGLEPVIMFDGRMPTLQAQAADAAQGHAGANTFTAEDIEAIVEFESTEFSSAMLAAYAAGGPEPVLPPGTTESEKRGRDFFITPEKKGKLGFCGMCHSGPMLNQMAVDILLPAPLTDQSPGLEARVGDRFISALVSEANSMANPPLVWVVEDEGRQRMILSPDIGLGAITGKWSDVNKFKITSLWGSKDRAPYFHDNSAKTIEEMVDHYADFTAPTFRIELTPQDRADIIAYMKLL